jgi:hypothetical protein
MERQAAASTAPAIPFRNRARPRGENRERAGICTRITKRPWHTM